MSATAPIDVRDMAIVHRTFRNAFSESAELVRKAPTPSAGRVTFLSDHIAFAVDMLHHHHAAEDVLLFPVLEQRAAADAAMVAEVGDEHKQVSGAIDAVTAARVAWSQHPTPETAQTLATTLVSLNQVLQGHLDDEEQKVVPLAAVTLTQEEWDALGAEARSSIPRAKMPIAFGMLLEPLNADDRAYMKSHLPAPIRLLFPVLIQRPWDKYADQLRNGT
jgi:hemerythrin-like domain-containing protein